MTPPSSPARTGLPQTCPAPLLDHPSARPAPTGGAPALLQAGFKAPDTLPPDQAFGPYWRRQYVFAAATMPSITFSDVGSRITKLYPDAEWLATDALHTSTRRLAHEWVQVRARSWARRRAYGRRSRGAKHGAWAGCL